MNKAVSNHKVQFTIKDYTFPVDARIDRATFDDTYMHVHLLDGRILSVPLVWIPSLANAAPADREKYFIGEEKQTLHWDPEDGPINEDLRLSTYLK